MRSRYAALVAFIASIVLANWATATFGLVPLFGGLVVTAGTFAAGFALVARDGVQVQLGTRWALLAIVVGSAVSALTSSAALGLASGVAFLASEAVDFAVFTPIRRRSLAAAVVLSSIASAPTDTVLFLAIAGFDVTWQAVAGQFIVKTAIALAAAAVIVGRK